MLICDRDTKWSEAFRRTLAAAGIRIVHTPYHAPDCNAYAERFVRSIKEECLDRLVILGEAHLRRAARIRRALSPGTESSRPTRPADRARTDRTTGRSYPLPPAAWRAASLLLSSGVMVRPDSRIIRARVQCAPANGIERRTTTDHANGHK
jgi:transposase InsO family protein